MLYYFSSDSSSAEQIGNIKMKELTNNTVEVTSCWVTEMLNSLKEEPNDALLFFYQMKESGFNRYIQTYMALIRMFCYWGVKGVL